MKSFAQLKSYGQRLHLSMFQGANKLCLCWKPFSFKASCQAFACLVQLKGRPTSFPHEVQLYCSWFVLLSWWKQVHHRASHRAPVVLEGALWSKRKINVWMKWAFRKQWDLMMELHFGNFWIGLDTKLSFCSLNFDHSIFFFPQFDANVILNM